MKTWMFALLESIIAALALAAYFLAESVPLATVAAVLAAGLGVAQPLIAARKAAKLRSYTDQQYGKSLSAVDEQVRSLIDEIVEPPLPHHATVSAMLRRQYGDHARELLSNYDRLVQAVTSNASDAEALADEFARQVSNYALASYMQGLAALVAENVEQAHRHFSAATDQQPSWIAPWLGWATTAHQQSLWEEIREKHPHLHGVEIMPYDVGDEHTFIALAEDQREHLSQEFQRAATSLGNCYTIAELCRSKQQIAASRNEYKKVA